MTHPISKKAFFFLAGLATFACESGGPARAGAPASKATVLIIRPQDTLTQSFEHHDSWLGQNLQFVPFDKLRIQLEKQLGRQLQNRGEAHITVLTPPEFENLRKCLSMDEIEALVDRKVLQDAIYVPECIGRGSLGAPPFKQETYFVVISAPALLGARKKIEAVATAKGCPAFAAVKYHPHVTLGFDLRDLHESDGVVKDTRACVYPLKVR